LLIVGSELGCKRSWSSSKALEARRVAFMRALSRAKCVELEKATAGE
jgi:hypothetical protein